MKIIPFILCWIFLFSPSGDFIPQGDMAFLRELTSVVIDSSRILPGDNFPGQNASLGPNNSGITLIRPGGRDCYPAFWIRDYAMSLESGMITEEEQLGMLLYTAERQSDSTWTTAAGSLVPLGSIPDHIRVNDGLPVFFPGTYSFENQGSPMWKLPPYDDQYFFIRMAWNYIKNAGGKDILNRDINGKSLPERLELAFWSVPSEKGTALLRIDTSFQTCDFGFRDVVTMSGFVAFGSILKYRAALEMADIMSLAGEQIKSQEYYEIASGIKEELPKVFFDDGFLRASTGISRQRDVWATAFAVYAGVLDEPYRSQACRALAGAYRRGVMSHEGQVRHVLTTDDFSVETAWERAAAAVNRYQNGAYWATPTGWVCYAINRVDGEAARELAGEYISQLKKTDFRKVPDNGGPYECIFPDGYSQNPVYMTSVTCPYAAFQRILSERKRADVSQSHYFDWINSQYEGTTEEQAMINLEFFQWMHDTYGMKLDIYSLDVGNMDDGPRTAGVGRLSPYHYGNLESREYNEQFPNGFGPLAGKAAEFDCRLGLWLGPGGFGITDEDRRLRKEMMVSLCRDHNFRLFKMDAVAGQFDKSEEDIMIETLEECREYTPDLIVSSHRVDFGRVEPLVTHKLWAGVETYVDVFINNQKTASHHREGSLERGLTPGMDRMYEDHGVCLSSCLDYWEDELILQAFNRSLILAPQIYGNPWFLKDEEYPVLARIFNLHRKYRDRIIGGFQLDSVQYGPFAVSRGDGQLRFITLRNISWEPVHYNISLNNDIGLEESENVNVRMLHPWEENLGIHRWGRSLSVEVLPFRTCLLAVGEELDEPGLMKGAFRVIPSPEGEEPVLVPMEKPDEPYHYHIADPVETEVPAFAESLFEATCFAGDNNALEIRSLERSGPSEIPQVGRAREAFVNKPMFINRGIWDRNLFDGDMETFFTARLEGKMLRLDFGKEEIADEIIIKIRDRQYPELDPELERFSDDARAEVSADLVNWRKAILDSGGSGTIGRIRILDGKPVRYIRVKGAPRRIAEVEAYYDGAAINRSGWRASNLFPDYSESKAVKAFRADFKIKHVDQGSYLCLALNGVHGHEKAWAALRVDGKFIGASDRAVSFDSNTWEYYNVETDRDYTYYLPVDESFTGRDVEAWVLILEGGSGDINPELWMTAYPIPWKVR